MSKAEAEGKDGRISRAEAAPTALAPEAAKAIARRRLSEMSDEEDALLTEAALSDPDNPPIDPSNRRPGRPPSGVTKQLVSLRLDRDVVAALRATGDGWQTRVNDALRRTMGLK